jgi:hypothetical protein
VPNLQPFVDLLSVVHPGITQAQVRDVLNSWGPGKFDAELLLDGKTSNPNTGMSGATLIPPAFGLGGVNLHTWTGWGSVPHWNAFHGHQEGRFFHGYYDCYCYLPLYIFCGPHLLAAKQRCANIDGAAGAVEEAARIVAQIRARWPQVRIVLRADSGFAREALMCWCELNGVDFVFGFLTPPCRKNHSARAEIGRECPLSALSRQRYCHALRANTRHCLEFGPLLYRNLTRAKVQHPDGPAAGEPLVCTTPRWRRQSRANPSLKAEAPGWCPIPERL